MPNQKKKGKKSYSRIEKLTPWLELWVIESPVVTAMMMMKMEVSFLLLEDLRKRKRKEQKKQGKRLRNSKKKIIRITKTKQK